MQCTTIVSSSINDVINGSHLGTAITVAEKLFPIKRKYCNDASMHPYLSPAVDRWKLPPGITPGKGTPLSATFFKRSDINDKAVRKALKQRSAPKTTDGARTIGLSPRAPGSTAHHERSRHDYRHD
ncbi:hypothetical protein EAG_06646 [Camponotus floridanus]|uniref:Uncharacterized protein n=1 Tax=Camponotus floridanus TaxID=104421 RepID=E2AXR2_CAMFO|nr:hypothetical protein EAG_06646 [Camponotus floridanus]